MGCSNSNYDRGTSGSSQAIDRERLICFIDLDGMRGCLYNPPEMSAVSRQTNYKKKFELLMERLWVLCGKDATARWKEIRTGDDAAQKVMEELLYVLSESLREYGIGDLFTLKISGSTMWKTNLRPDVSDIDVNLLKMREFVGFEENMFENMVQELGYKYDKTVDPHSPLNVYKVYSGKFKSSVGMYNVDLKPRTPEYFRKAQLNEEFFRQVDPRYTILITYVKIAAKGTRDYERVKYMWYEYMQSIISIGHGEKYGYILGCFPE